MVVVQVFDLTGQVPLGFQKVEAEVLEKAQELAKARGSLQVQGLVRVSLQDLDLAQVQGTEWEWVEESERESALAPGLVLDSVEGLVFDSVKVREKE
jgi:hypothetical protein